MKLRPCQKYQIIRALGKDIKLLCKIAKVSASGYYKWLKTADLPDKDYEDYLLIKETFDKGKQKYGWRNVKMHLERGNGITMNHKKIIRIMTKYGLKAKVRRKNPYRQMMKKTPEHKVFENKLDRNFKQTVLLFICL